MRSFKHISARTIEEACSLLRGYEGRAVLNAGGTDLLSTLKGENLFSYPEAIINIKTIRGFDYIRETKEGVRIGALAKLSDIADSPVLREHCPSSLRPPIRLPPRRSATWLPLAGTSARTRAAGITATRVFWAAPSMPAKGKGPCLAVRGDNRYHAIMGEEMLRRLPFRYRRGPCRSWGASYHCGARRQKRDRGSGALHQSWAYHQPVRNGDRDPDSEATNSEPARVSQTHAEETRRFCHRERCMGHYRFRGSMCGYPPCPWRGGARSCEGAGCGGISQRQTDR